MMRPSLLKAVTGWCVWDALNCDEAVARLLFLPELLFPFSHPSPSQSDQKRLLNIHNVGFVSIHMTAAGLKGM